MTLNRKFWPKAVRGLLSLSVLLGTCAVSIPLPIATPREDLSAKDQSQPFPCQNRPCGCQSAEQCWKKCCCFDNAQKIAWAKANNVKVPNFVLAAANKESKGTSRLEVSSDFASDTVASTAAKSTDCCKHCAKNQLAGQPSCCDKSGKSNDRNSAAIKSNSCESCSQSAKKLNDDSSKSPASKWVLVIYAAECQGHGPPVLCFPVSVIPHRPALVLLSVPEIENILLESERLNSTSLQPPLPPPKIV